MRKVVVAKTAGFCFGVKRAVDKVYDSIEKNGQDKQIYTYGPIIHNEEVVKDLESKGVKVINSIEELEAIHDGIIVIRSHGVKKEVYDIIRENGLILEDATCPFVKKIHNIVFEESKKGRYVVIIGNKDHPEVQAIRGWSGENTCIIGTEEEALKFDINPEQSVSIVSQTTFNANKFKYLVEIIGKKGYDINVLDTICNATYVRQTETANLAKQADVMIVIGGRSSSNTQKLYEISKKECNNTYYIQTIKDLDLDNIKSDSYVGITAGASTPNNIIEEVHTHVVRGKF